MHEDLETRRRRAAYRAAHRGSKEMDWLLGRFAASTLTGMSAATLERFEQLLALPDPDLQQLILYPELGSPPASLRELIAGLRAFHGLD
jgi:antitoxin CptB